MGRLKTFRTSLPTWIGPVWRGQLFLFDPPRAASFSSSQGYRLLAVFVLLEAARRPAFQALAARFGGTLDPYLSLIEMSLLAALACALVTGFAGVGLARLGLYSWPRWSRTEKFFFAQIAVISMAVFLVMDRTELRTLWSRHDLWRIAFCVFLKQVVWGFYQELFYRGLLQTELVRRWGTPAGVLAGNLLFTFGPLHAYHFGLAAKHPAHLWIFAGIFAIGMYFAVLFQRSGNLWIVATLHGLGDWFIDGLPDIVGPLS